MPEIKPYGSWESPISTDLIVSDAVMLSEVQLEGKDIYWLEFRPSEGGRGVIVHQSADGIKSDVTPKPWNVRTRVHEYGGGNFFVNDKTVYFSNLEDQRLYKVSKGQEPVPITPVGQMRYADGIFDKKRNQVICVREDHSSSNGEPRNEIVRIGIDDGEVHVLLSGNDFYGSPRLNSDGSKLTWLTWNHPNMPWDGTECWVAACHDDGTLGNAKRAAGGQEESIIQPKWSPNGKLYFASDRSGWWNLYVYDNEKIRPILSMEAEFGTARSTLGTSSYDFISAKEILCSYTQNGKWSMGRLTIDDGEMSPIDLPYNFIGSIRISGATAAFIAGSPIESNAVVALSLPTMEQTILQRSFTVTISEGYLSVPEMIEYPTENGLTAHAIYYPPKNKDYRAEEGERPPLLVNSHGGPTSAAASTLSLALQYWTSRGFAVLDVNYGGSTGYGRAYRERLNGQWGIVDVEDCINAARYLVDQGKADPDRTAVRGGSAGGYTTLSALTFYDFFKAGASLFGVSDLELLAKDTHKYESRYLDNLIGPYPEKQEIYKQRSPIHLADKLSSPVIFFQGTEDKVVPANQAERMADALREKGVPVALIMFEGEGHGFRKGENIKRSMENELYFYSQIFGFDVDRSIIPIGIDNWRS
ncbi:dipeptidyl aminopeptidase/acylaminoacyl peptidase [Scopulibacillus darangshiensis]|uniref:Dipeptidyl aminopeptidase/acylaminoacyl peptidase n=1 Tax=Scopulibacillus darangshiensis TaxID=442528 RepID=A0A4R2P8G3_9BACL|nr:S9 family peptidase [Scopulibacillus darangshiensis]TCP31270.1 dipeptidyl aminopeptidase/acylaminoacyl peptidase [Scopulibacillus darangshiensis]